MYEECTMYDCLLKLRTFIVNLPVSRYLHTEYCKSIIKLQINAKDIVIVFI